MKINGQSGNVCSILELSTLVWMEEIIVAFLSVLHYNTLHYKAQQPGKLKF